MKLNGESRLRCSVRRIRVRLDAMIRILFSGVMISMVLWPNGGCKVVTHSRYVVFQIAEVAVPKALFWEILDRIGRLRASPELAGVG